MPTFSRSLEQSLHRALALANERHHEYATLEHLLLALIEDQDAAAVMRACNVDRAAGDSPFLMQARRIAEGSTEKWPHGLQHPLIEGRGGGMIEINA